ncbi:MAG: hypothetical protein ACMXYM_03580 [Candidatus Woesearchaeota archaeon]
MVVEQLLAQAQAAAHRGLGRDLSYLLDAALAAGADPGYVESLRAQGGQKAYEEKMHLVRRYADLEPRAALDHLFEAQQSGPHESHGDEHDLWVRINTNLHYLDLNEARHAAEHGPDANNPEGWLEHALRPFEAIYERAHRHQVAAPLETNEVREAIHHTYANHYLSRAEREDDENEARMYLERARGVLEKAGIGIPSRMHVAAAVLEKGVPRREPYQMQPAA